MEGRSGPDSPESLILGCSPAVRELRREIREIAQLPLRSVLVTGETGVGKDLVAPALLACSAHPDGRLEVFNCPAIPADHLESEFFGTTRGAYPGAVDRAGAAERAHGGILFLDEIAAMPPVHQGKLLRFLESGEGRRLGAVRSYRVRVTLVAASNEDLPSAICQRRFREDLYYRLVQDAVLRVAPLRERLEDIPVLAEFFLGELSGDRRLAAGALERLRAHHWPGNVRELRAVVRSAARLSRGNTLGAEEVSRALERIPHSAAPGFRSGPRLQPESATPGPPTSFRLATHRLQRRLLIDALDAAGGNQTLAGMLLGMHAHRDGRVCNLDLRARKLAHRKFRYWWRRLVDASPREGPLLEIENHFR
jgi:two-component system NtrC family response regulator